MVELKELIIPIVVAVVSAIVTALVTIKIKYASSETEAITGLKSLGTNLIYYCWIAWLLYSLIKQVISTEPVTREVVFSIAVYTTSLAVLLVMYFLKKILKIFDRMMDVHDKHLDITHRIISLHETEQDTSNKANSADAVKRTAD